MSGNAPALLDRALALSQELLAAADHGDLQTLERLDAERLRLLQSLRLERDHLSGSDWLVIRRIEELNDRAIVFVEHHRRSTERALDTAAVGRRAVAAYSTTRQR
jgi:hypothetical protein